MSNLVVDAKAVMTDEASPLEAALRNAILSFLKRGGGETSLVSIAVVVADEDGNVGSAGFQIDLESYVSESEDGDVEDAYPQQSGTSNEDPATA